MVADVGPCGEDGAVQSLDFSSGTRTESIKLVLDQIPDP